jgi:hypothetical protein
MNHIDRSDIPQLVGIKEAAAITGWDQRKISLYLKRNKFLAPLQRVAAPPLWVRADMEAYAAMMNSAGKKDE